MASRALLVTLLLFGPPLFAQTTATWLGADGNSYAAARNWDTDTVPINDADTFNVIIPNSQSVLFDVDGSHEVTDLTLGSGTTLSVAPGESLTVLDDARLSGSLQTTGGTLQVTGSGAQFQGSGFTISATGGGTIAVAARDYQNTLADHRANVILIEADGSSTVDLSSLERAVRFLLIPLPTRS